MAAKRDRKASGRGGAVIVIKRDEIIEEAARHSGAWKVAYADFVTAMMAFFLLMWLLNATTEDQRKGLADYFSPNSLLSHAPSGPGQPFGGHTAFDEGALVSDRGSVQVVDGKRPTLDPADETDPQSFTKAKRTAAEQPAVKLGLAPDPAIADPSMIGQSPRGIGPLPEGSREPTQADIQAEKERQEKAAFEKAAEEIDRESTRL